MFKITKLMRFHAGHRLLDLPQGHKCTRLHGHTYSIEFCLGAEVLEETGMVVDYAQMVDMLSTFLGQYDHRTFLCKRDPLVGVLTKAGEQDSLTILAMNPTAEVIAKLVFDGIAFQLQEIQSGSGGFDPDAPIKLLWVEVKESETSAARVEA